jgi:dTDP-4-amino-4,6-dideoxygalactose transaminase
MEIAQRNNLFVVEDAAQAIDSFYKDKALGSIGHLAAFSFHETKNVQCGEGGMLVVNEPGFVKRAEIIWEKGTNRAAFFRGEIDKYGWVDLGSSFLPSEVTAAFLWAQLENLDMIQSKRKKLWSHYNDLFKDKNFEIPSIPGFATNNAHMFYLIAKNEIQRDVILSQLRMKGVYSVFHYVSLHNSFFYAKNHDGRLLQNSDMFSNCLLRLPLFYELYESDIDLISSFFSVENFEGQRHY